MSEKNFHAGSRSSQEYLYDVDIPTPSHAERARTLAASIPQGTLSTIAHAKSDRPGYPYGSLVTTALKDGQPLFLISGLAEHTKNLEANPRSSLLLTEAGDANPLALGRLTLVGQCTRVPETELEATKSAYFARHPDSAYYLEYGDFGFWRLEVEAVRYIGGFGRMSWVTRDDWVSAEPDPLRDAATGIIEHMNEDHVDAMEAYCRAFTKAHEFKGVTMTGVDRYGFEMSVETSQGWRPIRLAFSKDVASGTEVRKEMVALVKQARERLAAPE